MLARDFVKTEVDKVAEIHRDEAMVQLAKLMRKLYRRNPKEWKRARLSSPDVRVDQVFLPARVPNFSELHGLRGTDAVELAFDEGYDGDRVLAFVAGLTGMVQAAYNHQGEFFLLDQLDPQKLYDSARNVEIATWRLSNRRQWNGELFLLSNSGGTGAVQNLSFERLFGKVIAGQDTLARIVADRTNRTIRGALQRLVSAVFLPI